MMVVVQGELLRQQLLLRYCGTSQTLESTCKELKKKKPLVHQNTAASAADCVRGSLQLARAGMTLHDVQVTLLL